MNRILIVCGLPLLVSCGGAVHPAAAPTTRHADGAPALNPASPVGIETPSFAPPTQPLGSIAEGPVETAPSPEAPTWSSIFARYLAVGTEGGCGRSQTCHAPDMTQASSAYDWLERRGYIAGTRSPIASDANSCLRWFGGNMPPRGKPNEQAARDVSAWVAAGARND